jgi:hypothetical protein
LITKKTIRERGDEINNLKRDYQLLINTFSYNVHFQALYNNIQIKDVVLDQSINMKLSDYVKSDHIVIHFKDIHCIDCIEEILDSVVELNLNPKSKIIVLAGYSSENYMKQVSKKYDEIIWFNIRGQELCPMDLEKPILFILNEELICTSPFIPIKGIDEYNKSYVSAFLQSN